MEKISEASVWPHFAGMTDLRQEGKTDHLLLDIITIAICAVICGADTWPDHKCKLKLIYPLIRLLTTNHLQNFFIVLYLL